VCGALLGREDPHTVSSKSLPLVSIIVPNYNALKMTEQCIVSVLETHYPRIEVIVVDNGSTDGSADSLRARFEGDSRFRLVTMKENYGVGRAKKLAAACAVGEYLAFLDNDTKVDGEWICESLRVLWSDPTIGAVQSKLVLLDHPRYLQYTGGIMNTYGFMRGRGSFELDHGQYDIVSDVFFPAGAATVLSRKVLFQAGLPDENFFFYDDADLGWRIRLSGYRSVLAPCSVVAHKGGATSILPEFVLELSYRYPFEHLLMLLKNYSLGALMRNLPIASCYWLLDAATLIIRRRVDHGLAVLRGLTRPFRDFRRTWKERRFVQDQVRAISDCAILRQMKQTFGNERICHASSSVLGRMHFAVFTTASSVLIVLSSRAIPRSAGARQARPVL